MLSINQIFRLEWELLKSTGRLLVSDICFFLDAGGFSVQLMSLHCGDSWFVFLSADATDNWFDDEWICFDWSVVIEGCEIWFSVWDWQDTALVCYLMNCIMSIPSVFAETILHLRHLRKWFCFISFNALIYFGDFFFIYPWVLWVDPLPTFIAAYPIDFILFSASCIPYYSRFSFWLVFVTYVAYTVTVFRVTCIALPC